MTTPDDPSQPPAEGTPPPPPDYGTPPTPPEYAAPPAYSAPPPAYGTPPAGQFGAPPQGYGTQPVPYGGSAAYASWLQRVGAALVDGVIVGIPALILIFIGAAIGGGGGAFIAIIGYLVAVGIGIWNVVFRQGTTGQTLGKSQLGIKLIREQDGQVIGPAMSFVRALVHVVDSICYIGYLWPLWDAKRQTFADKIMSTIVIKL